MTCKEVTHAHGRSEILGMVQVNSEDIATLGLDGQFKVWNTQGSELKLKHQMNIASPYLHCFTVTSLGLSVGTADGSILFLDLQSYQIVKRVKFHTDLPTNLIQTETEFISAGIDGGIVRFTKNTLEVIETIRTNSPIWKIKLFNDNLYVCCDSTSLSISNFKEGGRSIQTMEERWRGFQQFEGDLYCYNESSIKSLNSGISISQGCDYLVSHSSKLLLIREQEIGIAFGRRSTLSIAWQSIPQLQEGYEIRNSVQIQNRIYLSGDAGNIYTLHLND